MSNKITVGNTDPKTVTIDPNPNIITTEKNYIKTEYNNSAFKSQKTVCDQDFKEEGVFHAENPLLVTQNITNFNGNNNTNISGNNNTNFNGNNNTNFNGNVSDTNFAIGERSSINNIENDLPSKSMGIKFGIGGAVSFISGLITILSWFYSLIIHSDSSYMHKFVIAHSSSIFFLGVILLTAGLWLLRIYSHHSQTKSTKI